MSLLSPVSWLYCVGADLRNKLYGRGLFRSYSLGAKTVSIGNITAGGTGKTPLVALVAKIFSEKGEKVCILTRGYGRNNESARVVVSDGSTVLVDSSTGGDEPVELARKLVGKAIVIADPDRVDAAKFAIENFGVTAFVMDDGFQHRRARRDLDIVCIDATDPFGGGKTLPQGRLRESVNHLSRAGAIVITRSNRGKDVDGLNERLSRYVRSGRIFTASDRLSKVVRLHDGNILKAADVRHAFAFCGLGNPNVFFDLLLSEGFDVAAKRAFADHHKYSTDDIKSIESMARSNGAKALVTTAKDAVKLDGVRFKLPCFVVEIETTVSQGFRELIMGI
ncbi:MAG: tetraacyldisaccharide 4'-kinase [Pyrinomonadaceae bacterium]